MSLTKESVREKMKEKSTIVLNVLSRDEYDKLHIKGSYNIPWGQDPAAFVKSVEQWFGREKFLITHCSGLTCQAGPNAAQVLKKAGFKAEDYPGGIQDWAEAGFPTVGSQTPVKIAAP